MRLRASLPLAAALLALAAPVARGADTPQLSPGPPVKFPERSWLLTLPEKRALSLKDIEVAENGELVRGLRLASSAVAGSAVVLAVDASNSMRGRAIEDAMTAARSFAARRREDQQIGVLFFNRDATVALEPTTDTAAIDAALAGTPELARGTKLFDAAAAAVDTVHATDAQLGSIVILSDGGDTGSAVGPDEVASAANKKNVRIHAVGLRSPDYDPAGLSQISEGGGYTEATSSRDLDRIFATLGERFSNEYLVTYKSEAPLDTRVAVSASIIGIDDSAVTAYETPRLDLRLFNPAKATGDSWAGQSAAMIVIGGIALLLALAVFVIVNPHPRSLAERMAGFIGTAPAYDDDERVAAAPPTPLLQRADDRLDRMRWWRNFVLDLELAKVRMPAIRLALVTIVFTAVLMTILVLFGLAMFAVLALAIPAGVRIYPAIRAGRVRRAFDEQLPDNLQVLASALRAGHSFTGALSVMAGDAAEPARSEFGRVVGDDQLGVPIETSMNVVGQRMRNDDVAYIGLVATIQRETGGNTAEVLDRVTVTVRERAQLRRLVRTLTAQGRLGGWIVTALPIALVAFLTAVRPQYLEPLIDAPVGRLALAFGVFLLGLGAFVINRIVDIKV